LSTFLIALVTLQPLAASAQTADSATVWRTFAANLDVGTRIEVRLTDGGRISATLVQAGPEAMLIQPRARVAVPVQSVAYEKIASIERESHGMNAGKAALIGVAAGAATFFGIFLIAIVGAMD
jgi:hypothetical protein